MSWLRDLKQGEIAENMFLAKYGKDNFVDVRKDKYYQKIDVDFLDKRNGDKIEVKGNFTKYDNMFLEIISSTNINSSGWYEHTEADYLYYIMVNRRVAIFIPMDLLKQAESELNPPIRSGRNESGNYGLGKCLNMFHLKEWLENNGYNSEDYFITF